MITEFLNLPHEGIPQLIRSLRSLADELELYDAFGAQSVSAETTISSWTVTRRAVPVLLGRMRGHPVIKDGRVGITTEVLLFSLEHRLARSQNRWYRLGEPMAPAKDTHQ